MHLFGHQDSGHAHKVALTLRMAGVPFDYTWVDIWAPLETRPVPFLQHSPLAQVPLLIDDDGAALTQSGAILLHIAETHQVLGGEDPTRLRRAREIILWEANRIGMVVPQLIEEKHVAGAGFGADTVAWLRRRCADDLQNLERMLGGSDYLVGERISIADIAVFGYMQWHQKAGIAVSLTVANWLERVRGCEGFATADVCLSSV